MATEIDPFATAKASSEQAAALLAGGDKLADRYGLTETPTKIGVHPVSAIGVLWFDGKKPVSVQARGAVTMDKLVTGLINQGKSFYSAYWARIPSGPNASTQTEVALSVYHTEREVGRASDLSPGDLVEVWAKRGPKGSAVFTYRTIGG